MCGKIIKDILADDGSIIIPRGTVLQDITEQTVDEDNPFRYCGLMVSCWGSYRMQVDESDIEIMQEINNEN
jgi:hypothetical protein